MAAIDDLNTAVANLGTGQTALAAEVASAVTALGAALAAIQGGTSDSAAIETAVTSINGVATDLQTATASLTTATAALTAALPPAA